MNSLAYSRWAQGVGAALLLLTLCGFVFFFRLGGNGIFDLDEGLYAESAREMHLSGDFVTPRVNGRPFFEKPPLVYWLAAGSISTLGKSELAVRLPSAVACSALALLILLFGTRFYGLRAGSIASAAFILSPLVFGSARQLTLDATLDLLIAIALFAYYLSRRCERRCARVWRITFWIACGLGVLAKSVPGIVIPATVAFLSTLIWERLPLNRVARGLFSVQNAVGLLVFSAIAVPWHYAAWKANGNLFSDEMMRQTLGRFRGGDTSHLAPFWFYVPGLLAGFFPWSLFLPAAWLSKTEEEKRRAGEGENGRVGDGETRFPNNPITLQPNNPIIQQPNDPTTFLKIWILVVFVIFSASGSKLISYILPLFAPATLLVGRWLGDLDRPGVARSVRRIGVAGAVLTGLLAIAVISHRQIVSLVERASGRPVRLDQVSPEVIVFITHLLVMPAVAMTGFLLALFLKRQQSLVVLFAGMAAFFGVAIFEGLRAIDKSFQAPLQSVARTAGELAMSGRPLILNIGPPRRPSVLFYLPDDLIPSHSGMPALVSETSDPGAVERFAGEHPRTLIMTSDKRAAGYVSHLGADIVLRQGGWSLVAVRKSSEAPPLSTGDPGSGDVIR